MKSNITIKEIALASDTSIGTVDRALNNRKGINPETKERILSIAKDLGYTPNPLASNLKKARDIRILVVTSNEPMELGRRLCSGIRSGLAEYEMFGVHADFKYTDTLDGVQQEKLLSTIDTSDYQAVLLNASSNILKDHIDRFTRAGVPVATFNSDLEESSRMLYVGMDSYKSGLLCGELMGKFLNGKGAVAILSGFPDFPSHYLRVNGFCDALSFWKDIHVVFRDYYEDNESIADEKARLLFDRFPSVSGVFTASGHGAYCIGRLIKERGLPSRPVVIGYDVLSNTARLLKENYISGVLDQDPFQQGYRSASILADYLVHQKKPDKAIHLIKPRLVMSSNVDDYTSSDDADT